MTKNKKFIEKAMLIHGFKYDYSKVEYDKCDTKICIICSEHGEFWQTPIKHLKGNGCRTCSYIKRNEEKKLTNEEFISKGSKIHDKKYDYSKVEYINNRTKVCIICSEHGEFWQTPNSHLSGSGCPKCGNLLKLVDVKKEKSLFINEANKIHNSKYDYSKINYVNKRTKVCISCPVHGDFWKSPYAHLCGQGCKKCMGEKLSKMFSLTIESFIEKANKIHNFKYVYSKSVYGGYNIPLIINCPIHGEFKQTPDSHLQGSGCQKCGCYYSKKEEKIFEWIKQNFPNVEEHNRKILDGKELDIYIPLKNIAIEYNGLLWHSEKYGKDKNYHLNKTLQCKDKGIKLIHIFEDEMINNETLVYNKLKHILKINDNNIQRIAGRKCIIKEISKQDAEIFLNKFHIQGFVSSTIYLGAFYEDKLIAAMTFKKEDKESLKWDLNRFASDFNYICQGVGGKLFKYFIRKFNPKEIKSFADRRWTIDEKNNVYIQLGFKFKKYVKPSYSYIKSNSYKRIHKFNFRKQILNKKYGLPLTMTESEMTEKLGYFRIWDCGLIKYVWKYED